MAKIDTLPLSLLHRLFLSFFLSAKSDWGDWERRKERERKLVASEEFECREHFRACDWGRGSSISDQNG